MVLDRQYLERSPRLSCVHELLLVLTVISIMGIGSSPGVLLRAQDPSVTPQASKPLSTQAGAGEKASPRPCSFQQVTPGETRLPEVLQRLGQPLEELERGGERVLSYQIEPFARVEVSINNEVVASIVMHLKEPASYRQIEQELQLENLDPVLVTGEAGQVLGRVYPERGLLLNFAADTTSNQVAQLMLDPITSEPFVLRVKHDARHQHRRSLDDLDTALRLDSSSAEALALKSEILSEVGQVSKALKAIDQALQLAPGDTRLSLQRARLLFQLERHDEAMTAIKDILENAPVTDEVRAGAECLYGDLLADGPSRNYHDAIKHHMAAIKLATPRATERNTETRRTAKVILLKAFLASAHDIAAGDWQQRSETTARWLGSARELADAMITKDHGDETARLLVQCTTLAAQADLQSQVDPSQLLSSIEQEVARLKELSGDGLFAQSLDSIRAKALFDAAIIEHGRHAKFKAFDCARQAVELLDPVLDQRELIPSERLRLGQLYFFVGSCHAVVNEKHDVAVRWYERARGFLTDSLPPSASKDLGRQGERFVSMGASYWETDHRDEALELTRRGLDLMKQAARQGLMEESKLALPYGNLAAMYKLLGRSEEARNFAEIAGRIGTAPATSPVKR